MAVGRVIFAREANRLPLGSADVIADLIAAGIATSRGGPWTRQAFQGLNSRIRRRCAADPAFAEELRSGQPPGSPACGSSYDELRETQCRRLTARHTAGTAEEAARRVCAEAAQTATQQASDALVKVREEANRLVRKARRTGRAALKPDIRQSARRLEAGRVRAQYIQEHFWPIVAPMLDQKMTRSAIAAELNRLGVPKLQGASAWTGWAVRHLQTINSKSE